MIARASGRVRSLAVVVVPPLLVLLAALGFWYLMSYQVLEETEKFLLPPPHELFTDALMVEEVRADVLDALWVTTKTALVGLAVSLAIGVVLAVAMAKARWIERSVYPYAVFLQTVPILAIVPLVGFWFGYEMFARVLICVIISLFPLIINPLQGLLSADRGLHDLFTLSGASGFTRLIKLQVPAALPDVFVGLQVAAGLSVVGATVGDLFFGRGAIGLGLLMQRYSSRLQSAELLATVMVTCLLGLVVFWIFGALGRRLVGRWSPAWGAR
ncbi:ABC transporter permease [Nocardioides houyundeii]|uniref:ABC transporter permease n=1 Tax=Nocardioides houyundeii TaxID=2045452 RepID=UPI001962D1C0|nr:ABC transporter permease subunit [Nocardioides houyundeii]